MQAPRELDLAPRKGNYGCSEVGAMLGVDPFNSPFAIWARKYGGVVTPTTKEQQAGKIYEDATLRYACVLTGINFNPGFNKTLYHPEYPNYHLIGTPDGLADDPEEGGAECKEVDPSRFREFGSPSDVNPIVPPAYELQCRSYMALTDRPRWRLFVHLGGSRLLVYVFERDLEFERFILDGAERVHVAFRDGERPPIDGHEISALWLKQKYPTHKRPDIRPATDDEIAMLHEYGQVRAQQKACEKQRAELENRLKEAIKDREGLEWEHGRFTWRLTKDSTWVDWESLAISLRTNFLKTEEERAKVTLDHTRTRAGSRRIYFRSDEFVETEEPANAA